jgi:hypothetical protein
MKRYKNAQTATKNGVLARSNLKPKPETIASDQVSGNGLRPVDRQAESPTPWGAESNCFAAY